jgi:hypothetical protein
MIKTIKIKLARILKIGNGSRIKKKRKKRKEKKKEKR